MSAATYGLFIWKASFMAEGRRSFSLFDDAMISMRYALNLASGHGLVWNPGEAPIEGYTNLLWTLWMAVVHMMPIPIHLTSLVVSISGAAILILTAWRAAHLTNTLAGTTDARAATVAALLVGLCFPLMFWTLRGMEVGLIALLLLRATEYAIALESDNPVARRRLAGCLALMTLIRIDTILPAMVIAAAAAGTAQRRRWQMLLLLAGVPVATLALLTAGRVWYYGDWLPNTYYLKMTGTPLTERIARGVAMATPAVLAYFSCAVALVLTTTRAAARPARALPLAVFATLVSYSIYVGGDVWETQRFLNRYTTPALAVLLPAAIAAIATDGAAVPWRRAMLLPLCGAVEAVAALASTTIIGAAVHAALAAIALGLGLSPPLLARATGLRLAAAAVLLFATTSSFGYFDWMRTGSLHVHDDAVTSRVGLLVGRSTASDARIAVVWAGAIPYFSQRSTIDLLGKSDARIARMAPVLPFRPGHNKFDYGYSIGELRPDLVLQLWSSTSATEQWLTDIGYIKVGHEVFVAKESTAVDGRRLAAELPASIP